ncbi:MAG: T9SS type A sorting domain-containing protein, partial [Bacteroidales bacterium]|nr:T9SS type A sorting domain-containing protein [Bacteroidales bacterium]
DFDNDGDLDAAVAKNIGSAKQIWVNDGAGNFTDSGQELTTEQTKGVDVGDIDNDGDIDIFYACGYDELQVWMNDGLGNFMPGMDLTGLNYGATEIVLVDLNFDGNLDLVTNGSVLINDLENAGTFINVQYLSGGHDIEVADVNNDYLFDIYAPYFGDQSGDAVFTFDTPTFIDEEITLCYGDSLWVINTWQTEAGIYLEYADCEEYTRYDLSFYDEINTEITEEGGILTVAESGATYQWIDCNDNNSPIPEETAQTYTPSEVGIYAVEIIQNEICTALSDCYIYNYVGISQNNSESIKVYPNPTTGIIKLTVFENPISVSITDIAGKTIYNSEFKTIDSETIIDISNQPNGVYFMKLQTEQKIMTEKIIKK